MKFEVNEKYKCHSACDHNCVWIFEVIKRTAKQIVISDGEKEFRCKIHNEEYNKDEFVFPLGNYSMCPILRAKNIA